MKSKTKKKRMEKKKNKKRMRRRRRRVNIICSTSANFDLGQFNFGQLVEVELAANRSMFVGDSNRQRSMHLNEDGRKDLEGEEIVGRNSFCRRRLAVRLADPLAGRLHLRIAFDLSPMLSAAYDDAHDADIGVSVRALSGDIPQEDEQAHQ